MDGLAQPAALALLAGAAAAWFMGYEHERRARRAYERWVGLLVDRGDLPDWMRKVNHSPMRTPHPRAPFKANLFWWRPALQRIRLLRFETESDPTVDQARRDVVAERNRMLACWGTFALCVGLALLIGG